MFARIFAVSLLTLAGTALLSACGGGGGTSSPAPVSPPTSPAPAPEPEPDPEPQPDDPLRINPDNALDTVRLSTSFAESLQEIETAIFRRVIGLIEVDDTMLQESCESGSSTSELLDRDGDRRVTAGDTVVARFSDCSGSDIGGVVSGTMELAIDQATTRVTHENGELAYITGILRIPTSLVIKEDISELSITGAFSVTFRRSGERRHTSAVATGTDFLAHQIDEYVERLSRFEYSRDVAGIVRYRRGPRPPEPNYGIEFSGAIRSEELGGSFECQSAELAGETVNSPPDQGAMTCIGANDSAAMLAISDSSGHFSLSVKENGGGEFEVVQDRVDWADLANGELFALVLIDIESVLTPGLFQPVRNTLTVETVVRAIAYSAATGKIYAASDERIRIFDPDSGDSEESIGLDYEPVALAVSPDGYELYVGLDGASFVQVIDLRSNELADTLAWSPDLVDGSGFYVTSLATVPGANGVVAVSVGHWRTGEKHYGVAIFKDGGLIFELPHDEVAAHRLLSTSDGRLFGNDDRSSRGGLIEFVIKQGATTEIEAVIPRFGLWNTVRGTTSLGSNLVAWNGDVLDIEDERLAGNLSHPRNGTWNSAVFDAAANRLYVAGWYLVGFDLERFVAVNGFAIPTSDSTVGHLIYEMADTGNAIVALLASSLASDGSALLFIPKESLFEFPLESCETVDLAIFSDSTSAKEIECPFVDIAYEESRDLLYATVPGHVGHHGNSVAVIDVETATIDRYVPVGSQPRRIEFSAGGRSAIVELAGSGEIVEMELDSDDVSPLLVFDDDSYIDAFSASPLEPNRLLLSRSADILAVQGTVHIAVGGTVLPKSVRLGARSTNIWLSPYDADTAYVVEYDRLHELQMESDGLRIGTTHAGAIEPLGSENGYVLAKRRIYDEHGSRTELDTGIRTRPFVDAQGLPSFDESNDVVLFFDDIDGTVMVYDDSTGSLLAEHFLFAFDPMLHSNKLLSNPPDHLVLAWRDRIRVVPKVEVMR